MSLWSELSHADGQALADRLSADRPFVGRTVRVDRGRKHFGKVGRVVWHGRDRFSKAGRYGDSYVQAATEVCGRWGFRIGIETPEGERFFVSAENVMVAVEEVRS